MKTAIVLFCLLAFASCKSRPDWKLVWSDEFNYSGLPDSLNWTSEVGFIRNHELQYYTKQRLENAVVKDGNLMIIGKKEAYDSAQFTSACINTDRKHSWTYGRIEARIKLPVGQGIWPAFWMLGENIHQVGWPKCGEIDIMEHINNENVAHGTLHWFNVKHVSTGGTIPCDVTKFHDYAIEWDNDSIKLYLDDKQYHTLDIKENINSTDEFHKPQYIILNMAIGGDWPKNPDASTVFPDTMFVDYVRVFQKTSN
jgi:beta-glucanase (GH16 family)